MEDKAWIEGLKNIGPYGGIILAPIFSITIYDKYYPNRFYWVIQIVFLVVFIVSLIYVIKGIKIMDKKTKHSILESISKDPEQYFKANGVYKKIYDDNKSSSNSGEFTGGNLHIENNKLSNSSSTNLEH